MQVHNHPIRTAFGDNKVNAAHTDRRLPVLHTGDRVETGNDDRVVIYNQGFRTIELGGARLVGVQATSKYFRICSGLVITALPNVPIIKASGA